MTAIRTIALAAAFALAGAAAAPAMTVADLANGKMYAASVSGLGDAVLSASPNRAAQDYFDYDALITIGALALAGGGLAAMGAAAARRRAAEQEPAWRETVFRAVQADLAQFAESYRRAA